MPPTVRDSIARAEGVAYRYPQNNHGLQPTDLVVRAGERLLVTGASGSGKSTLARCLTGLIPHLYRGEMEGTVWLGGQRTKETPLWQLAEQAGLVFQNPAAQMLAETVEREILFGLENLGLARAEMARRLEETLARFDLGDKRHRSPQTLSGGEQQKLALAAIMARQPPLLVLDEPLSMLDGTAAVELVAHLRQVAGQGAAVVVCEHRHEYFQALPGLRTMPLGMGQAVLPEMGRHPPLPAVPPLRISVTELSVRLGRHPVLDGLSFEAAGGQVVAIVGRNGVGKTTLLRALAGLQKYDGQISVDGERPDLGLVFQNSDLQIFNASVRDEIVFRLPACDEALYRWLLAALGLERYEAVPPLLLSEGEKKRVALATVLMRLPRHGVLLDEPSLGQDAAHKEQLIRVARAVADTGRLVVVTTHDLSLAAQADRLLLMSRDGFVADGPPALVLHDERAWGRIGLSVPDWIASTQVAGGATTARSMYNGLAAEEVVA